MNKKFFYGVSNYRDIEEKARAVCEVLGGGENAFNLLVETAAAETLGGVYRAPVRYNYGVGLCQFDKKGFDEVKTRITKNRRGTILHAFNVDIKKVEYRELAYSPLLSLLFCRLLYLLKPGKIPGDLQGRAAYWKKFYNSTAGAGTVEGYIKKVNNYREGK